MDEWIACEYSCLLSLLAAQDREARKDGCICRLLNGMVAQEVGSGFFGFSSDSTYLDGRVQRRSRL